jgi:hypothetical protein
VTNPVANFTAGTGNSLNCFQIQTAALSGAFAGSDYCSAVAPLVQEPCGCEGGTGGPATYPPTTDNEEGYLFNLIKELCVVYTCTCDIDDVNKTATFDCSFGQECKDVYSFCPDPLSFCEDNTIAGTYTDYDNYVYKSCYTSSIEPYQFQYCIEYEMSAEQKKCTMTVDGITCNSCKVTVPGEDDTEFYAEYNCLNTVLGRQGKLRDINLIEEMENYFVYQSLPCPGGCNLCGADAIMMKGDASFTHDDTVKICFQTQLDALIGPRDSDYCKDMVSVVSVECGCQDPPTLPPTPPPAEPAPTSGGTMTGTAATVVTAAGVSMAVMNVF